MDLLTNSNRFASKFNSLFFNIFVVITYAILTTMLFSMYANEVTKETYRFTSHSVGLTINIAELGITFSKYIGI